MDYSEFEKMVKKYFHFLEDDFHFFYYQQVDSPYMEIFYTSDKAGIRIVLDRGTVELQVGNITDPQHKWFELVDIMRHFAPEINDVDKFVPILSTILIEEQLLQIASWIKTYCIPLLIGDFSMEMEINEARSQRIKENLRRLKKNQRETRDRFKYSFPFWKNRDKK
jgi:hypothetical protein